VRFTISAVIAIGVASPVRADQAQPWVVGVSEAQKAKAQKLLEAGNGLFLERKYAEALERYNAALAEWDHPAIRFNIVRCLIQLEKPVEAADQLKLSMKYGPAPFDEQIYSEALAFEKLLATQVGEIEIECTQPGVQLTLDGRSLFACPGKESRRVAPGQHQVVGTKSGFMPKTQQLFVVGGKHERAQMSLELLSARNARIEHRWPAWLPWTVFAGGFALAGVGELAHLRAVDDNSLYEKNVVGQCKPPCTSSSLDHSLESTARLENGVAIGLFSVGAAAAVTGAVMLYLNRGHAVYETAIVPTPGGAAVTLGGAF
jgi:hypothetical protein